MEVIKIQVNGEDRYMIGNSFKFVETKDAIHVIGITKEEAEALEKETGKKVVSHKSEKELKKISTDSELSDFNKKLVKALDYRQPNKDR